jgi:hypothetical protein
MFIYLPSVLSGLFPQFIRARELNSCTQPNNCSRLNAFVIQTKLNSCTQPNNCCSRPDLGTVIAGPTGLTVVAGLKGLTVVAGLTSPLHALKTQFDDKMCPFLFCFHQPPPRKITHTKINTHIKFNVHIK